MCVLVRAESVKGKYHYKQWWLWGKVSYLNIVDYVSTPLFSDLVRPDPVKTPVKKNL